MKGLGRSGDVGRETERNEPGTRGGGGGVSVEGVQNYGDTVAGEMYMCSRERSWRMPPAGHKVRS